MIKARRYQEAERSWFAGRRDATGTDERCYEAEPLRLREILLAVNERHDEACERLCEAMKVARRRRSSCATVRRRGTWPPLSASACRRSTDGFRRARARHESKGCANERANEFDPRTAILISTAHHYLSGRLPRWWLRSRRPGPIRSPSHGKPPSATSGSSAARCTCGASARAVAARALDA